MQAEGLIQQLTLQAQGAVFTLPVYVLPISRVDLTLGQVGSKPLDHI